MYLREGVGVYIWGIGERVAIFGARVFYLREKREVLPRRVGCRETCHNKVAVKSVHPGNR